jgi:hypothetical protein
VHDSNPTEFTSSSRCTPSMASSTSSFLSPPPKRPPRKPPPFSWLRAQEACRSATGPTLASEGVAGEKATAAGMDKAARASTLRRVRSCQNNRPSLVQRACTYNDSWLTTAQ